MPYWDQIVGTKLYPDEICKTCSHFLQDCNVWPDMDQDEAESKYNLKHIVRVGQKGGREDYMECKSYQEYTPPDEKPDPDPAFMKPRVYGS